MKVELHSPDWSTPDVIGPVLNYTFSSDDRLLFLYDVKDTKNVDPIAIVVVDHWATIRFVYD